jgi:hypothetical protein
MLQVYCKEEWPIWTNTVYVKGVREPELGKNIKD